MMETEIEIFKTQLDLTELKDACLELDQVECPLEHHFSDGLYTRVMKVPGETLVIGKVHRFKTLNIMTKGKALVYVGEGQPAKEVQAPFTYVSDPMERKMAYFLEDSEWINVHPTHETDLEKIEQIFIVTDKELVLINKENVICLG